MAGPTPANTAAVAEPARHPATFIKRVPAEAASREVQALQAVDHPGVVRLLDWKIEDEEGRLSLGFIEGQDLETLLASRGGRLDQDAVIHLMAQIAEATEAIHATGFLHRDLKPANIRMGRDDAPVIVDLGAATPIDAAAEAGQPSQLTHGCAAPEQYLSDGREGPWTDVYALGALTWRVLTGEPPPSASARLLGTPLPSIRNIAGELPATLAGAIEAALALEPASRPQTARRWRDLLLEGQKPATTPAEDEPYPPTVEVTRVARRVLTARPSEKASEPPRRRRTVGWLLGLLLLVALGAAIAAGVWYGRPLYERWVKQEWLVDPAGGGDALTITDALRRSGKGARIRIAPGTYAESLRPDHAVQLEAADSDVPPLIAPEFGACAVVTQPATSLRDLELRRVGGEPDIPCLHLAAAALIERTTIQNRSGPAILIDSGAQPELQDNTIEDSPIGLVIEGGAEGTIAGNIIRGSEGAAILVRGGARPTIEDNTLEGGGLAFSEGAAGLAQGNRVIGAQGSAVVITSSADPVLRDNRIEAPGEAGIFVYDQGRGSVEGNRVVGAGLSGVVVTNGGEATLTGNVIEQSGEHGILVVQGGDAVIRGNTITESGGHGIAIGPAGEAELDANELSDNGADPPLLDGRDVEDPGS